MPRSKRTPPSSAGYIRLDKLTVLVVDDNANTRTLIAEVLRCLGVARIMRAESAAAGRAMLNSGGVDLVFADIEMPGENGLEFVRRVRAATDPRIADVAVVMVSAHATATRVIEAGAMGANSFLCKPFSVSSFARRLAEAFAHRQMVLEAAARRGARLNTATPAANALEL